MAKALGKGLKALIRNYKDDQNVRDIDLLIKVSKEKIATTKDSAGKILEYKITLNTKVEIKDFVNSDKILDETFIATLTYKVQNQYSDTVDLENRTIEDLINKIYQKLLIKLSQNI